MMIANTQIESGRVDTLIITVGTRQVGWRCQDGAIRSFGADGNIGYPRHVEELYRELSIERSFYSEKDKTYPWSAQDLGKRYYEHCVHWLGGDFNQVEMLLDQKVINAGVKQGLKHIILWGTDQPESVSWFHRRLDTLWLAELMAGKIKGIYPDLRVDVYAPKVAANDSAAIREELEKLVLQEALKFFSPKVEEEFVLWIQNKGCVPAIASGVEICAAALVRQCQVYNATPEEPDSFFETLANGSQSACPAQGFKLVPMGDYFWPLERMRVISAWERGDFSEAQIWLKLHQSRYPLLYKLAGGLDIYTNWETPKFLTFLRDWLRSRDLAKVVSPEQIVTWQAQLLEMQNDKLQQVWEFTFLIEMQLLRKNYTLAFIQFVQTTERLLSVQCDSDNWIGLGFTSPPRNGQSDLSGLIQGWCRSRNLMSDNKWYKLLNSIRYKRNKVIHGGEFVTWEHLRSLWTMGNLFSVPPKEDPQLLHNLMIDVLKKVSTPPYPETLLVRSLYDWGVNTLRAESADF
jgi:hypothetical protein